MQLKLSDNRKIRLEFRFCCGFGAFWGWFSLIDLMIVDWLTLVTEFIGMTSALSIFGIAPWITVAGVVTLMEIIVINGRYWTWVSGAQRGVDTATGISTNLPPDSDFDSDFAH